VIDLTVSECARWGRLGGVSFYANIVQRDIEALRGSARTCAAAARRFRRLGRESLVRKFAFGWALARLSVRAISAERALRRGEG
jgi:hypothetical protein